MYNQPQEHHRSSRFYLVMFTVVIAGIFVLLLSNGSIFNLTGATVGLLGDKNDSKDNPEGLPVQELMVMKIKVMLLKNLAMLNHSRILVVKK